MSVHNVPVKQMIQVMLGRFGPFLKYGREKVKFPKEYKDTPTELPYDVAVECIIEAGSAGPKRKKKGASSKGQSVRTHAHPLSTCTAK